MSLEFNWKYKNYEMNAVPQNKDNPKNTRNYTIELVKYGKNKDGSQHIITIAYWDCDINGYKLKIVRNNIFDIIEEEDVMEIWRQMKLAQKVLNKFEIEDPYGWFW